MMHGADGIPVQHTIAQVETRQAVWIAGASCLRHEVIGEEYSHQHMQRIAASLQGRGDVLVPAWLVPDSGSVAVWSMGSKVGYLPPATGAAWLPVVVGLARRHNLPVACQASLDAPSTLNGGILGMVLWLPVLAAVAIDPAPAAPAIPTPAPVDRGPDPLRAALYKKHIAEVTALRAELADARRALDAEMARPRHDPEIIHAELRATHQKEVNALRASLDHIRQALDAEMVRPQHDPEAIRAEQRATHQTEVNALRASLDHVRRALDAERARPQHDPEAIRAELQATHRTEINALRGELNQLRQDLEAANARTQAATAPAEELLRTRDELRRLGAEVEAGQKELRSVEEALEIQSFGFYTPKYGFESSAQYTARLKGIREEQQRLIKGDQAAPCDAKWTVGGSAAEGKKMVKQQAKLMLRAFNGECDAAIAKVRYDNAVTMEKRLEKAYADVNKLGEVQRVFVSRRYLDSKLAELHLVHEHREKVEEEKAEQKRIRDQMREEQKAQAEIERAKAEADKEQAVATAALEKARAELAAEAVTNQQHEKLEALVSRLENELTEALDRKAKAIARAQLTRSGHVYVLSNVGSFGDGVYKIGLTRRLDPHERVDELGDASVPFPFDVHAVIFAEDAPGLETKLHKAFASRRVNLVNLRKEYFRVSLEEIQGEVKRHHGFVSFTLTAEAEEYRKSLAAREAGVVPELMALPAVSGEEMQVD